MREPPVRVAFVGKGGSGKSVMAGTFARVLGRKGREVLAIDSDPMPGLAWAVGVEPRDAGIPDEAVQEGEEGGPRYRLRDGLSAEEAVERYAIHGPDRVRILQFGKFRDGGGAFRRSQHAFSEITKTIDDTRWHLVGDLPAGTRQPFFGWARYADTLLVVVEPTLKSVMTARRLALMAEPEGRREGAHVPRVVAVANKVREEEDVRDIAEATGLEVIAEIPDDPALAAAERRGEPPIEGAAEGAAVRAIESLAQRMCTGDDA